MSVTAAAADLNVSVRSIRRWISEGKLPGYRIGTKTVRVDQYDVDQLARLIPTAAVGDDVA
jgi:excisionase family DNA binding protein